MEQSITVLGRRVQMSTTEEPTTDTLGRYMGFPTPRIWINALSSEATQAGTFLHEYAHALWDVVRGTTEEGMDEEEFARMFELGVRDLYLEHRDTLRKLVQ